MYTDLALHIDGQWLNGGDRSGEDVINPATVILSYVSPKPAMATCVACLLAPLSTSLVRSVPTATCAAGVSSSPNEAERTQKRERSLPLPGNWLFYSIACGRMERPMTHSFNPRKMSSPLLQLLPPHDCSLELTKRRCAAQYQRGKRSSN